jgi:hypothetical protein
MVFTARQRRGLLALLVFTSLAGCATQRSWTFVQEVGGMSVGAPVRTPRGVVLPVDVDVSGLREITVQPRAIHSSLAARLEVARIGWQLELALYTAPPRGNQKRYEVEEVLLGDVPPGRYTVVFRQPKGDPIGLGSVDVP